ncbi:filamentous hemagglutinin family protein [Parvibaculum indicum]|uniref:two-partner secretion domain-containing protein n=1 Tax=Parvibaculum indicum TaxID=562969 RepID=UPI00141DAC1A|nr:filamentous hemagglutinin N-terminal domain-containing protein [Parvibaculum indicum]NIJ41979.1 filamentous hemagglutinin family protein [Parvibaculum indicum]
MGGYFFRCRRCRAVLLGAVLAQGAASAAHAADALPTGGHFTAGVGSIGGDDNSVAVSQSSNTGIIDWNSFSIGSGHSVVIDNGAGATLNRVNGSDLSRIDGLLSATGSAYLINRNGIVIGRGGKVVTGGSFVGSTRDISNEDFLNGDADRFAGTSSGDVVNQGTIRAEGGDVVLIGRNVSNSGSIDAPEGTAAMVAGNDVVLQPVGGDRRIYIQSGAGDGDLTNDGAVTAAQAELAAAGGNVYALAGNTEGVIRATGSETKDGRILLTAGGEVSIGEKLEARNADGSGGEVQVRAGEIALSGTVDVSAAAAGKDGGEATLIATGKTAFSGKIDAKGGEGGTGGFVETSGATLTIADTARVTTLAQGGTSGIWLIDPNDLTIAASGGDITGATLSANLEGGNVALSSNDGATDGNGDIFVNDALSWSAANTLTLTAVRNIEINEAITAANGGLTLAAGSGATVTTGAGGAVDVGTFSLTSGTWEQSGASLPSFNATDFSFDIENATFLRVLGGDGSGAAPYRIFDTYGLQGIASESLLAESFVLANDIDASGTAGWNGGLGFDPIGNDDDPSDIKFTGSFDGQDNTISGLTISRPGEEWVGLFGNAENATFSNLVLSGGSVTGGDGTGSLLGELYGGSITSVSTSTTVAGAGFTGGLAGVLQYGTITLSSASGDVTGSGAGIGGLAGVTLGMDISRSYATGAVSGAGGVGGLLGSLGYASADGVLDQSFATGAVTSSADWAGGLVGSNEGTITNSYATGAVTGTGTANHIAGFVGQNYGSIGTSYSTGLVTGPSLTGGFAGINHGDPSNITSVYWNTETSGQAGGIGSGDGGITGLTTAEMQGSLLTGFDDAIWEAAAGLYPYLEWLYPDGPIGVSGFAYSDAGATALTGAEIGILSGGSILGSTGTGANGYYYYLALPGTLDADGALAYLNGEATQGAAFSDSVTATGVTGIDILGPSLNLVTGEATLSGTVANLTATLGLFADTDLDFIDTSATQLTANGYGLYVDAASDYLLDQDLTAGGLLSLTSGGDFSIDADRTLKTTNAGSILVDSGFLWSGAGTLTLNAADNIAIDAAIDGQSGGLTLSASGNGSSDNTGTISTGAGGAVTVGNFVLTRGVWDQVGGSLPSFSAESITVSGLSTFIRAQGGDGTYLNPYQLFDVYGLQGIADRDQRVGAGSFDYSLYYELANDIDASATSSWNSGAGFDPVNFSGSLDGAGHTIDGLYINRPSESNVALISYWQDNYFTSGRDLEIKDLTLTNASVTGDSQTAILVGDTGGGNYHGHNMSNVTVSGTVETNSWGAGVGARYYGNINQSTMTNVHADVSVTVASGGSSAAGLVSIMGEGLTISNSSSTGTINGGWAGGLVGTVDDENNRIETSYSTATVIASGSFRVGGGLVGETEDLTISNSYFAGQMLGIDGASAGGLVGSADRNTVIENSFVTGLVEAEGYAGALVADVSDSNVSITNAAWDIGTTGQSDAIGYAPSFYTPTVTNTGSRTTAQMQGTLDFGLGFSLDNTIWATGDGLYPYFSWQYDTTPVAVSGIAYGDNGSTALAGANVNAITGGDLFGSAVTGANGYYYILREAGSLDASGVLAYLDGESTQAAALGDNVTSSGVTGLNIYGSSLNLVTNEAALSDTVANLTTALGSYTDTDIDFIDTSATQLTASGQGLYLNAASNYMLDRDLTAGGLLSLTSGGAFTIDGDRVLKTTDAGSILLNSGVTWNGTGTLTLTSDDDIALNGAIDGQNGGLTLRAYGTGGSDYVGTISTGSNGTVDVGTFNLPKGYWYQVGASLPSFEALDFRTNHHNASFVRVQGGDGSVADPYQLFDVYGLQGITGLDTLGNQPSGNNGRSYQLVADIDATGTSGWNGGAGFAPVFLAGSLDGGGHTIDGLYVYKPPNDNAGLIGTWDNQLESGSAVSVEIKDLSLTNAHVVAAGNREAGILFGHSQSYAGTLTLANIYVSGTVSSGGYYVGGVGGYYSSTESRTATNIRADVDVSGGGANSNVGGLFGYVEAGLNLTDSSFTGTVSGTLAGGLIGYTYDDGSITNSWASATVTSVGSGSNVGGLVGRLDSNFSISDSWFSGSVLGTDSNALVGGLVGFASDNVGISNSFTSGSTIASGDSGIAGGLVGMADGLHVSDSYASGSTVASGGSGIAGGLIGWSRRASVSTSYASGLVDGALSGGLVGQSAYVYFNLTDSVWDREASGQSVAVGDLGIGTVSNVDGVTSAQMRQLSTFLDHGFDIDGEGGTASVWRIYEGYTAPLLRSFLTALTITGGNGTKTYNGGTTSTDVGTLTYNPSGHDSSLVFGTPVYTSASDEEGSYSGSDLTFSGLYSSQLGYDITLVPGMLTIGPDMPPLPDDPTVTPIVPRQLENSWSPEESAMGPGEESGGFWALPLILEAWRLVFGEEPGSWTFIEGDTGRINRIRHVSGSDLPPGRQ